jgi:Ca2+-binding EF-hand superfamily protein
MSPVLKTSFDLFALDGYVPVNDIAVIDKIVAANGMDAKDFRVRILFKVFDTNGDGLINETEFKTKFIDILGKSRVRQCLSWWNFKAKEGSNGEKNLPIGQLPILIKSLDSLDKEKKDNSGILMMDYFDENKDGKISFEEFKAKWFAVKPYDENSIEKDD